MAVPSSGELKLWDTLWNQELAGSKGENSLHSASVYAGFSTPDALSDFYGWSDVEVPSVTTNSITSVTFNSLTLNGNVTDTGNENVSRGWYFGTTANPYSSNTKTTLTGTQGTGTYSQSKSATSSTTYYAWAFACNSAGEAVGSRVQASTPAPPFYPRARSFHYFCNSGNAPSINAGQIYYNGYTGTGNTNANSSSQGLKYGAFVVAITNSNNRSQMGGSGTGVVTTFSRGDICALGNYFNSRAFTATSYLQTQYNQGTRIRGNTQQANNSNFNPNARLYMQYNYTG